jgi:hypothetical protein
MKLTEKEFEELKAKGKFRGITETTKKHSGKAGKNIPGKKKGNKAKEKLGSDLWAFARENKFELRKEFVFHPDRKWRFDYCFPALMLAIEYEGLMSDKSRHTTISGFTGDTEKYNAAQQLGWKVMRYTAMNYKTMIGDLNKIILDRSTSSTHEQ